MDPAESTRILPSGIHSNPHVWSTGVLWSTSNRTYLHSASAEEVDLKADSISAVWGRGLTAGPWTCAPNLS